MCQPTQNTNDTWPIIFHPNLVKHECIFPSKEFDTYIDGYKNKEGNVTQ